MKKKLATALMVGQEDGGHDRPGPAREQRPAAAQHEDADQQVDPAPGARVELEGVVAGHDEELVVDDRHEAGDDLEAAHHDHHGGGEGEPADGEAGHVVEVWSSVSLRFY